MRHSKQEELESLASLLIRGITRICVTPSRRKNKVVGVALNQRNYSSLKAEEGCYILRHSVQEEMRTLSSKLAEASKPFAFII